MPHIGTPVDPAANPQTPTGAAGNAILDKTPFDRKYAPPWPPSGACRGGAVASYAGKTLLRL